MQFPYWALLLNRKLCSHAITTRPTWAQKGGKRIARHVYHQSHRCAASESQDRQTDRLTTNRAPMLLCAERTTRQSYCQKYSWMNIINITYAFYWLLKYKSSSYKRLEHVVSYVSHVQKQRLGSCDTNLCRKLSPCWNFPNHGIWLILFPSITPISLPDRQDGQVCTARAAFLLHLSIELD